MTVVIHNPMEDLQMSANPTARTMRPSRRQRPESKARARVAAAFRKIGNGADAKTAYARTTAWYRSSGGHWAHCLS